MATLLTDLNNLASSYNIISESVSSRTVVFPQSYYVQIKHQNRFKPMKSAPKHFEYNITVNHGTLTNSEGKVGEDMRFLLLWFPSHFLLPFCKRANFRHCLWHTHKKNQELSCNDLEGCQSPKINITGPPNSVTSASSIFFSLKLTEMKSTDCLTNHCRV